MPRHIPAGQGDGARGGDRGHPPEIDWITRDMGRVFPREWDAFTAVVSAAERGEDLPAAYARLLAGPNHRVREDAARAWCTWEDTHVSLMPGWTPNPRYADLAFRMVFARLVTHYWSHGCFLADGQILAGMKHLARIPATMIHGRYDISSPLDTPWALHQTWPGSQLVVVDDAGHGGGSFASALITALNSYTYLNHHGQASGHSETVDDPTPQLTK